MKCKTICREDWRTPQRRHNGKTSATVANLLSMKVFRRHHSEWEMQAFFNPRHFPFVMSGTMLWGQSPASVWGWELYQSLRSQLHINLLT
jgi:hypothetical protein